VAAEVRRPIEEWEVPLLKAFGRKLRNFRTSVGLTQDALAVGAMISRRHVIRLEQGHRRPRTSTIRRLADALSLASPSLPPGTIERARPALPPPSWITRELVMAAGAALAPESIDRDRIERRRDRKQRRIALALRDEERIAELLADEVMVIAPVLAEQMFQHRVRRHEEAKRQAAMRAQKRKEGLVPATRRNKRRG
jgi:transcriptional regulator with XRE-family HTH domain